MKEIKNILNFDFTYEGDSYNENDEFIVSGKTVVPNVEVTKVGNPSVVAIGDSVSYRVDIVISDGDGRLESQVINDTIDDCMKLVEGTLQLDGVLLEKQSLNDISVDFEVPSNHYLTYECIRMS